MAAPDPAVTVVFPCALHEPRAFSHRSSIATLVAGAACALAPGCDRQPLDTRTGGGGVAGRPAAATSGGMAAPTDRSARSIEQVGRRLPADILILLDASVSMNDDATQRDV